MSDRLPRDREKALDAIASGTYTGRTATTAHPLCVCRKPRPRSPGPPIHDTYACCDDCGPEAWDAYRDEYRAWLHRRCPVH